MRAGARPAGPLRCRALDAPVDSRAMSATHRRGSVRRIQVRGWSPAAGLAAIAAASLLALLLAAPVLAHAELTASDPDNKAVLATPPTVITLTFSEGLDQDKSSFKVIGAAGSAGTGKPAKQGGKVMTLDGLSLEPGAYTIQWTAAATDGHVERGKLTFTVSEPTPAPATPSPTPAPTDAPASAAPSAASTAAPASAAPATEVPAATTPAASPADGGDATPASASGTDVLIPIVVGLVLVAGLGGFLFSRSRRA